jgi:hypothetical protein
MTGTLATPTFVTGAKDILAAADVYARTSSTPINSVRVISNRTDMLNASGLRGGPSMANSLPQINSLILSAKSIAASNSDSLTRLTNASSVVSNALRTFAPGVTSGIIGNIGSSAKIIASVGGVSRQINSGNLTNVNAIGALINTISKGTGNFSIKDNGALIGTLAGVVIQAARNGIPNSFGSVLHGITDKNIINRIAAQVLPIIINKVDLSSLSTMSDSCSVGALKMINPSIISDVALNYTAPVGEDYLAKMGNYTSFTTTFAKIDPSWATTTRATENGLDNILNLTNLQGSTPDFQSMMAIGIRTDITATSDQQAMLLASVFPPTSVEKELLKQFPLMANRNGNQSVVVRDPRTIAAIDYSRLRSRAEIQNDISLANDNWSFAIERETGYLVTEANRLEQVGDFDGAYKKRTEVQRIKALIDTKYATLIDKLAAELVTAIW